MAKYKCNDCGTVFNESQTSCPTCGCPREECSVVNDAPPAVNENSGYRPNPNAGMQQGPNPNAGMQPGPNPTMSQGVNYGANQYENNPMQSSSEEVDASVLNFGRGTAVESFLYDAADKIEKWGSIILIVIFAIQALALLIASIMTIRYEPGLSFLYLIVGGGIITLFFFILRFFLKVACNLIRLYVNISTNLKRMELRKQ